MYFPQAVDGQHHGSMHPLDWPDSLSQESFHKIKKWENRSGWVPIISTEDVDPNEIDTDGDELPDVWENAYGFDPMFVDAAGDRDEDGLTNLEELAHFTSPLSTDTDGDGLTDYEEVKELNTDPTSEDGDGDGYSDAEEIEEGTDPNREDRYPGWDFVLVNYGHKSFLGSLGGWTGRVVHQLSQAWVTLDPLLF